MITKFQLFENRQYLDAYPGFCPVCNTKGKVIDKEQFVSDNGEYTFKCPVCDFWWKNEFDVENYGGGSEEIFSSEPTDFNGDIIEDGFTINDNLYDEMKLQANKYNL